MKRRIDVQMPSFRWSSAHATPVEAPPDRVYRTVRELDFSRSTLVRALFFLRGIPPAASSIEGLLGLGFVLVDEVEGEELLLGLVGRPWTPGGGLLRVPPDGFREWREPGYVKMAWNFAVEAQPGGARLSTETRIDPTDRASRRRFALYWRVVGPFSGWVRREILRAAKAEAERGTRA